MCEQQNFSILPSEQRITEYKTINIFKRSIGENIDDEVVTSFGEEWLKFHAFQDNELEKLGKEYFDIVDDTILNKNTYVLDMGCGSGRYSKYIASKVGFIEAMDPSDAVGAANVLLKDVPNVRISKSSVDNIPFANNTFDFVMTIGVLHHIPDTLNAMKKCVEKVKQGGFFYVYLYYALDNRSLLFRFLFQLTNLLRLGVSSMPHGIKKFFCDMLAVVLYMPLILLGRILYRCGFKKAAISLPLSNYQNKSFFIIRNDALDRFGTKLEQRFSKVKIEEMMINCGLSNINFSNNEPYWHAIGKKS